MSSTIEEIGSIIGAQCIGNTPASIDWILTDSRSLFQIFILVESATLW